MKDVQMAGLEHFSRLTNMTEGIELTDVGGRTPILQVIIAFSGEKLQMRVSISY